ncbi:hypothetical protein LEMLEM_LOCUS20616, partial [Lemmus lemmus]
FTKSLIHEGDNIQKTLTGSQGNKYADPWPQVDSNQHSSCVTKVPGPVKGMALPVVMCGSQNGFTHEQVSGPNE